MKGAFLLLFVVLSALTFGQNVIERDQIKKTKYHNLPTFGGGVGFLSFDGDVADQSPILAFNSLRVGYFGTIEQRVGGLIGFQASGTYGSVSKNEYNLDLNRNFESSLMGGELTMNFYFDRVFSKEQLPFAPYFGGGAGYYMFDPHGDLEDENGNQYFYWGDGLIRNVAETPGALEGSDTLYRDYTYETELTDSVGYDRSTLVFPIQAGFRFKMSQNLSANISATYHFTQTDYLDNVKGDEQLDAFLTGRVSVLFHIGGYDVTSNPIYEDIDFTEIDRMDVDGDGVRDDKDQCPGTPEGVEVNNRGCALDDDKDGVPDYLDKEKGSPRDSIIDIDGTVLTEKEMLIRYADSLATKRKNLKEAYPSMFGIDLQDTDFPDATVLGEDFQNNEKDLKKKNRTDAKTGLPGRFAEADKNYDGEISTEEIYATIDAFFEGSISMTIDDIYALIDFFFEQ